MTDIPGILALSIPIVAIIVGGAITILRMVTRHRERLAMIEAGLHPDYPPLEDEGAPHASATARVPEAPPLRSVGGPASSHTKVDR